MRRSFEAPRRPTVDLNRQYPLIVEALSELPEETVVDGEVVALNQSGIPNFNLLQNYRSEASRIHFFIFDLLIYKGHDLTRLPLIERREELPDEQVASSRRTTPPSTASVGRIVLFLGTRRRKVTGRNSRRLPPHFVNDKIHRQCS
jgi:ATP dependent DNA ligase domain